MGDILVSELLSYDFVKEDCQDSPYLILIAFNQHFTEEQMKLLVDKLEINGAACVFYGDKQVRIQGLSYEASV